MNPDFNKEILRRIEDSEWDIKMSRRVLKETISRKETFKKRLVVLGIFFSSTIPSLFLGVQSQNDIAFEETAIELLSQINPVDAFDLDEE